MKHVLMILVCAASLGCFFGPRARTVAVAREPNGTSVKIMLPSRTITNAELLAVSDTDITMLWSDTVWSILYAGAREMAFSDVAVTLDNGRRPTPVEQGRLRLASRFPQGLSPNLEARMLAAHHQPAVAFMAP